jgi:hypothetical protein
MISALLARAGVGPTQLSQPSKALLLVAVMLGSAGLLGWAAALPLPGKRCANPTLFAQRIRRFDLRPRAPSHSVNRP